MASRREALAALDALSEVFGDAPSERGMELYAEALADLDAAMLALGVKRLIREAEYFPRPAEIRKAVADEAGAGNELALPLFPPDERSLDEIAERRRELAPLWSEVRRVANGGELRPFAEVLGDLDAGRLAGAVAPTVSALPRPLAELLADFAPIPLPEAVDG